MKITKKILKILSSLVVFLFLLTLISMYVGNSMVDVASYSVYSKKVPEVFNDYKIVQIADFHNSSTYKKVAEKIKKSEPNVIVITGDLLDLKDNNFDNVNKLLDQLSNVAPIYFSSGNHEVWSKRYDEFIKDIEAKGVKVLDNKSTLLEYSGNAINIIGYKDIIYDDSVMRYNVLDAELQKLYNGIEKKQLFNLLLFHRGNLLDNVSKYPFDLVLSAHTHGGQIGIPFIRDEILLKRYFSAKYSKGYYRVGDMQAIISGGLSKRMNEPRFLNNPEITEVTLKTIEK